MDMYSLWLPGGHGVLWLPKQSPVHVVTCVVRDLPTTSGDWGGVFHSIFPACTGCLSCDQCAKCMVSDAKVGNAKVDLFYLLLIFYQS